MTFELSRLKILALVVLLLAAGGIGTLLLAANRSASPPTVVLETSPSATRPTDHSVPVRKHAAPAVPLTAGLPAPLRSALAHNRLVVAVVYAPGDAVDAEVLAAAQQGAATQHAPVVRLDIRSDSVAAAAASWMGNVVEPAVLVVERPGTIVVELDGYTDATSVAQAVADAPR